VYAVQATVSEEHVHEWRVAVEQPIHDMVAGQVTMRCFCGKAVAVANRLPIEVPE
jgi:hypothetical protein